ncbi:unnamed protein product [Rhizoctonia solani]|uniref:Proteasome assembly chaperone 2 n=1 Tax=Rhizoctonia solani TaxID=456999 RepID=A0A8H2XL30_9AGAM|nr:unnamed protein product [Rhizoctonia solani]
MSDRPFFRLSASGPGLPADKSNTILIVPVVSAGNVSQLCADLLIHTLALRQVGIFDPGYYAPAVGGKDGEHSATISTPMELFGRSGGDIFVLQQRSPVLKGRKEEFVTHLLRTIESSGFGSVLYLVGSDQSARTDDQMGSNRYVILAKDTTRDSIMSTPLADLLQLPPLGHSLADQDDPEKSVIPGTGLARRLLRAPGTTPSIALVHYVAEGDNLPDAHAMATTVAETLKMQIQGWTQPPSWSFAITHEEIEGKLLKLYKRHTAALEADVSLHKGPFAARSVALKIGITDAMVTLEALRSWYAEARNQWVLATRALDTRIRHHNAFYNGGDAGHIQYLDFLRSLISELEEFMQKCDELGYEASLITAGAGFNCIDDSNLVSTSQKQEKEQCLIARHTRMSEYELSRRPCVQGFSEEEYNYTTALSPSLFVRARTWEAETGAVTTEDSSRSRTIVNPSAGVIANFISSAALTQNELERLLKKLPFVRGESMSAELIRGAVADTFRSDHADHTSGNCIPLLGGWVYEKAWSLPMPPVAWDALHQLVACAGCALGVSRSFQEALLVRRFAFVGGRFEDARRLGVPVPNCLPEGAIPRFPRWQDQCSPHEIAMRILGVWLAADNRKTKRSELKKFTPKAPHGKKSTYSEHEERHWAYMRVQRSDERLASFVDALNASQKFTVLAQHNTKPKPTHVYVPTKECDAWVSRVRSGTTPVARRSARWTTSTVFRMEIFEYFHKRAPEAKAGLTYLDETEILDVVVMDNANGEWADFLKSVGDMLLVACGYSSLDCMLAGEVLATAKPGVSVRV